MFLATTHWEMKGPSVISKTKQHLKPPKHSPVLKLAMLGTSPISESKLVINDKITVL
jgi:hypothetical protein